MPDIYIKHPLHGQKVCHSEAEASYDRSNGWVDFDPYAKGPQAEADPIVEPAKAEDVVPDFFNVLTKGKKKT